MDTAGQAVICLDASSGYSDGTTFTKITSGSWSSDRSLKSVTFSPQQARYVRLEATQGWRDALILVLATSAIRSKTSHSLLARVKMVSNEQV